MQARGLDAAALAAACRTTPERLESWLGGTAVPRAGSVLRLSQALGLSYAEVSGRALPPEPEVVLLPGRARISSELTQRAHERMLESAHYSRRLRAFLPGNPWAPLRLAAPTHEPDQVRGVAARVLEQLRGAPVGSAPSWDAPLAAASSSGPARGPLWVAEGARLLAASQVLLVPLLAGEPAYPAALVRDPESGLCTAFVDVAVPHAALARLLVVLYGCALTQPGLPGPQALRFGELLADELVGTSDEVRRAVSRHRGHRLADVLELDRGPLALIRATRRELHSPVFEAFDAMQRHEGGRDHAAMLRLLQTGAPDGYALTGALWFGDGWEERAREAGVRLTA